MKIISLLLIFFLPFTVFAGDEHHHHDEHDHDEIAFEDHAAHVHGHANASISYADGVMIVRLTLASKDVFGFEHIPKNEQETEAVISNLLYLEDFANVLTTDPACAVQNVSVDSENLPENDHADHHDGEDHADHHDKHDHNDHHDIEHSDVNGVYELHCSSNIKLTFKLLEKYSSIEKIAVQYVSSSEQRTFTVTHDNRTITLHK